MAIRYDNKLNNEIKRIVNNYNAKITRLENSLQNYVIPTRITQNEIKSKFSNRTDLKRYIKDLGEFTKRGGELPLSNTNPTPKYLYNQIKRKQRRLSYNLNKRIKFFENAKVKSSGVEQTQSVGSYNDLEYKNLIAKKDKLLKKDLSKLNETELLELSEKLTMNTKTNKDLIFQENFIDMLSKNASTYGINKEEIKLIQNKLKKLKPYQFYQLSKSEQLIKQIVDYYSKIGTQGFNQFIEYNKEDIVSHFQNLYENIDFIIEDYV